MKLLALAFSALLLIAAWYYQTNHDTASPLSSTLPQMDLDILSMPPEDIDAAQRDAANAALVAIDETELQGPVTTRPHYVSAIEWKILQGVAAEREDGDKELTRLVNFLRFSKQLEWWQQNLASDNLDLHQRVGKNLLDDIPHRVKQQDIAAADAQQLQVMLLEKLVADPQQRRLMLQREAQRIGLTFEIREASLSPPADSTH
mgnify:CR=1 FL=1